MVAFTRRLERSYPDRISHLVVRNFIGTHVLLQGKSTLRHAMQNLTKRKHPEVFLVKLRRMREDIEEKHRPENA